MSKWRWLLLVGLTLLATVVDQMVIKHKGLFASYNVPSGWYHYIGWALTWLLVFFIVRKRFWLSMLAVVVVAAVEDALFLLYDAMMGLRPFYPLYCHGWMTRAYGAWVTPFSYNWFGMPSFYYFVALLIGVYGALQIYKRLKEGRHA